MNESDKSLPPLTDDAQSGMPASPAVDAPMSPQRQQVMVTENRRWWITLILQPLLFLACGAALIAGLGVAQRLGFISAGGGGRQPHVSDRADGTRYICPMMCTPPQAQPGRCPVCGMELVPATSGSGHTDSRSIHVDPATRRIANIHTVAVSSVPMTRMIKAIGELNYDEGTLKTIAAYVDGRLDRLYADYTGVVVNKGDHLALVYSPLLYSSQVELLLAKKARDKTQSTALPRVALSGADVYESAKERLVLLGMTEAQIDELEKAGKADSRLQLLAPSSGTVIEKMAVEGQYVKEGDAIYKLADLSTVWLMLRLFPEDAASIRYGQRIDAEMQSLPGRHFSGRVAFIDPQVDPRTRTVGVRVVIPNKDGLLRVGDYAKATIAVPLTSLATGLVYDPELANKWVSPRHPHVVAESAGQCRICGADLVPAAQFGFADQPSESEKSLVVPRDAVLMAGNNSVVYVETEPGRFEIRRVVLGPSSGDQIVILSGVEQGEHVATRGNFLIDSQMQLAGNPSLIDPTKAEPAMGRDMSAKMLAALSELSPADRALVEKQGVCPVASYPLGSMGTPKKVDVKGTPVFICCEGCREALLSQPDKYLAKIAAKPNASNLYQGTSPMHSPPLDLPPIGVPQMIEPEVPPEAAIQEAAIQQASPDSNFIESAREVVR